MKDGWIDRQNRHINSVIDNSSMERLTNLLGNTNLILSKHFIIICTSILT